MKFLKNVAVAVNAVKYANPIKIKNNYLGLNVLLYSDDEYYEAHFINDKDETIAVETTIVNKNNYFDFLDAKIDKYKEALGV